MGRRDAVQAVLEIVAETRRLLPALVVSYEPGWERRGNGTAANYVGGVVHHTASPSSQARPFPTQTILRDGRSDLPGPLCNFAGPWCTPEQPRLHVMAANPANHAGASGGRSIGPLPKTNLFNPLVVGLEIDYAGSSPMSAGQLLVSRAWARAVATVLGGGNVEHVRAHAETSITGKWDPGFASGKTIDMAAFRRDAAALTPTAPEDDMLTPDQDKALREIHWELRARYPSRVVGSKYTDTPVGYILNTDAAVYRTEKAVAAQAATIKELVGAIGKLAGGADFDEDALVARIEGLIHVAVVKLDAEIDQAAADNAKRIQVDVSVKDPAPSA